MQVLKASQQFKLLVKTDIELTIEEVEYKVKRGRLIRRCFNVFWVLLVLIFIAFLITEYLLNTSIMRGYNIIYLQRLIYCVAIFVAFSYSLYLMCLASRQSKEKKINLQINYTTFILQSIFINGEMVISVLRWIPY